MYGLSLIFESPIKGAPMTTVCDSVASGPAGDFYGLSFSYSLCALLACLAIYEFN
jgi:hypothetical protein